MSTEGRSYEHLVKGMRTHWRREAALREHDYMKAQREKERGDQIFLSLVSDAQKLLAKYARSYFGRDDSLVEDGTRELIVALYSELRSIKGSIHDSLWESRFGYCLQALANAQFVRRLQRQYGKARPEQNPEEPDRARPYFEQKQADLVVGPDDSDRINTAPDPASAESIPRLLDQEALKAILAAIPDAKQCETLKLWYLGWKQDQIARHMGCDVKTVYNRLDKAILAGRAWAQGRYRTHDEFSEWVSG